MLSLQNISIFSTLLMLMFFPSFDAALKNTHAHAHAHACNTQHATCTTYTISAQETSRQAVLGWLSRKFPSAPVSDTTVLTDSEDKRVVMNAGYDSNGSDEGGANPSE